VYGAAQPKNAIAARLPFIPEPAGVARFATNALLAALGAATLCRKRGKDMIKATFMIGHHVGVVLKFKMANRTNPVLLDDLAI
jgi:hypothetical protein